MNFHKNARITPREFEVLKLLSMELSTKEIAKGLFLSNSTIESHRRNLLIKMQAKNTAGLMRRSFELGIFTIGNKQEPTSTKISRASVA